MTPLAVVQAQLDAFNSKDIDALMRAYAPDAEQFAPGAMTLLNP